MDIRNGLNRYGFCDNVPYKSACENIKDYLDEKFNGVSGADETVIKETIKESINGSMNNIRADIHNVDHHLSHVERHLTDEIHAHSGGCCGCCDSGIAESDMEEIISRINQHTDEKFEEANISQQFSDLNEQVAEIAKQINQ